MSTVEGKNVVSRYQFLIGDGITNVNRMTEAIKRGANEQRSAMSRVPASIELVGTAFDEARRKSEHYYNALNKGANVMLGIGTATTGLIALTVRQAAGYQMTATAFKTLLGSADKAKAFLGDMKEFAKTTPFQFTDVTTGARRLLAMGFTAQQVKPMLTAVGDATAAMGGSPEMFNRVIMSLGQIRQKGKLSAEEMMQLAEAGIPAWEMLAQAIGTDIPTAMKRAQDGAIDANTAIDAITTGMGTKFKGAMDELSKTTAGRWSNLVDQLTELAVEAGDAFLPLVNKLIDLAQGVSGVLKKVNPEILLWVAGFSLVTGAGMKLVIFLSQAKTAWALLTAAKAVDTLLTNANTAAVGKNSAAMLVATGRATTLGLALKGVGIAATALTVGYFATGYFLDLAAGTNKAVDAANAEMKALDAADTKRKRMIDSLQREVDLYKQIDTAMTASQQKTNQLAGSKQRIQTNIKEITDLLGIQVPAWDGTIEKVQEFIDKAREAAAQGNAQRTVAETKQQYLALQEQLVKASTAGGSAVTRPIRESAGLAAYREKVAKNPKLAADEPEKILPGLMTRDRVEFEKLNKGKFSEEQWAEVLKIREEMRSAYLQLQIANDVASGKLPPPADTTPPANDTTASKQAQLVQNDLATAKEEANVNRIRRAIDSRFAREWGQRQLLATAIGGHYATQLQQQQELARAQMEHDRAVNDARNARKREAVRLDLEESLKKPEDQDADALAAKKDILKTEMEDALDAAAAALEQKKLSVELEIRKSSWEQFKDKMQNAFELTILGPRFKEMYKASFAGMQGQMASLAALAAPVPMASLQPMPLRALAPAGAGGPSLPMPSLPAPGASAGKGEITIKLQIENNPKALGIIKALAQEAGVEVFGQAVGGITRGG
ncbi:MAG: tape measure protein [Armatimonadota bacterium]